MRQLRRRTDLAFEAREHLRIARLLGADHLHGAGTLHHLVFGQIDLAHAAAAKEAFEAVLAELLGDESFVPQRVDRVDADDGDHCDDRHQDRLLDGGVVEVFGA